jgi:hypothetical protein
MLTTDHLETNIHAVGALWGAVLGGRKGCWGAFGGAPGPVSPRAPPGAGAPPLPAARHLRTCPHTPPPPGADAPGDAGGDGGAAAALQGALHDGGEQGGEGGAWLGAWLAAPDATPLPRGARGAPVAVHPCPLTPAAPLSCPRTPQVGFCPTGWSMGRTSKGLNKRGRRSQNGSVVLYQVGPRPPRAPRARPPASRAGGAAAAGAGAFAPLRPLQHHARPAVPCDCSIHRHPAPGTPAAGALL